MARRKSNDSGPTPEEIQARAEEQAAADRALLDALEARAAAGEDPTLPEPEEPRGQTLGEQYESIVELVATMKRKHRLSEVSLIKLWELNLMWILNNRQQAQPSIPAFDYGSDGSEDVESEPPTVNETLDGTPEEESN